MFNASRSCARVMGFVRKKLSQLSSSSVRDPSQSRDAARSRSRSLADNPRFEIESCGPKSDRVSTRILPPAASFGPTEVLEQEYGDGT